MQVDDEQAAQPTVDIAQLEVLDGMLQGATQDELSTGLAGLVELREFGLKSVEQESQRCCKITKCAITSLARTRCPTGDLSQEERDVLDIQHYANSAHPNYIASRLYNMANQVS